MQRTRFSERELLAQFGPFCLVTDSQPELLGLLGHLGLLGLLGLLEPLGLLTPVLAQHRRLSRRRRLKSTTMDNVFKETSEHLFLSCSPTVIVFHLMVKLFYHFCAKFSGYVNVYRLEG